MQVPRCFDFKTLLWWFMVLLQFFGGSYFRSGMVRSSSNISVDALISEYYDLALEFNVIIALLFILNYLARRYFIIYDRKVIFIPGLNIQVQFNLTIDLLCSIISIIYLVLGVDIILKINTVV